MHGPSHTPTTSRQPAFGDATDADYQGFVSYAHANQAAAWQLLTEIDVASKVAAPPGSCFPRVSGWWDDQIAIGQGQWRQQIAAAVARCDFGIFLLSNDLLLSEFVRRHEWEPIRDDPTKIVIVAGLAPVDFGRARMHGFDDEQVYRWRERPNQHHHWFTEPRPRNRRRFAMGLIEGLRDALTQRRTS